MNEKKPLFRQESIEARRYAWLGRPTILHNISATAIAIFAVVFVVAVICFLAFGQYTRRVRVSGVILPIDGLTRIVAPHTGWVADLKVKEGDNVKSGDVLYVLSIDITTALGNTQDAVTKILSGKRLELQATLVRQTHIEQIEKQAIRDQVSALQKEIPQVDQQIQLLREFMGQLDEFTKRQEEYLKRGVSTSRDYESRLQAFNSQRSEVARLGRERVQLGGKLDELNNQLAGFDLQSDAKTAETKRQMLDIEQQISESEARRAVQITAPRSGMVTGIITQAGQTVTVGTPLLTIVPTDRPLVAQLLAPSNAVGFVREQSTALLRYEAFPYQKFGQHAGHVSIISRANLRPEEVAQLNAGGTDPQSLQTFYRITVQPEQPFVTAYGRRERLQVGMQVEAHLLVDTRPLYQWVLEPIYGLRGSLTSNAATVD
jgi:membrane fusion protein